MADTNSNELDILEIMKILPQRYPFLLVDRITSYEPGKSVTGYKNVSANEAFFAGHFPENPIMPGVLQIEAMAQMSAAMVSYLPQYQGKMAFFAGIDKARFKKVVRPGDKLEMSAELIKIKGPLIKAHAKACVDGQLASEAELSVIVN